MVHRRHQRDEGIALVIATIFLAVAVLVVGALAIRAVNQNRQVAQYVDFRECFEGLEAAYAQSKTGLEFTGDGSVGLGGWALTFDETGAPVPPSFDDTNVAPVSMGPTSRVEYMGYVDNWGTDGIDNNGDGNVDDIVENRVFTIHAFARNGAIVRQAEAVVRGDDVNVWRNAIFGGTGQAGGLVNGNVSIHGSVHLLGTNILEGNLAVAALDLGGTSLIHNNYVGMPAGLAARIPPLPKREFNGETVDSLDAKLRVRNGLVGVSGNSEIGESDVTGNTVKETMDGTYVNDGWTGTNTIDDGDRGDPQAVYSDNGWDELYDLGNRVPLPLLNDDWRDPLTGATVHNPVTGKNYTHQEYFTTLAGAPYVGSMTINANANFYYNASRPADPDPTHRQSNDDYILFNAATNTMEVNGQLIVTGNLTFARGGGGDKTISYTGRAAILVLGDASIDTDLLTVNSNGSTASSFPAANCLGIMTRNNMTVGSLSQLQLMGAFYAQNVVKSTKQTVTLGTLVGNYFDMGTNVPDIFQVPSLADNLPWGMIGAYPILIYDQVSWREIGV